MGSSNVLRQGLRPHYDNVFVQKTYARALTRSLRLSLDSPVHQNTTTLILRTLHLDTTRQIDFPSVKWTMIRVTIDQLRAVLRLACGFSEASLKGLAASWERLGGVLQLGLGMITALGRDFQNQEF